MEAENLEQLTPGQLQLIASQRWFHLFVPEQYGGLSLSLPEAVQLEESIAWADGNIGWVVTLCSGASMFIGYFQDELTKTVFSNPRVCLAGSGQAGGIAERYADGFKVTGSWPHASGAPHADYFTANCVIRHNGEIVTGPDEKSLIQSFLFKKEEVTLYPTWKYMGLKATAGYSFSVEKLFVPTIRTFIIDADHTRLPGSIYQYPFAPLAESTIAANISGMCLHFLDLAKEIIFKKKDIQSGFKAGTGKSLQLLADAVSAIQLLREQFYERLDHSWKVHVANNNIDADTLLAVSESSRQLAHQARHWVSLLYPFCGLAAAHTGTFINRVWRNIHTASQHSLLNDKR
ncbi:MAG: acyl-CoA dehydrogenase [Chitinophagaceae bacterium]|nr:acyl-CoA dehydrogenase [Chitinophagaceae bacterium]